jgi:hypothetical protein
MHPMDYLPNPDYWPQAAYKSGFDARASKAYANILGGTKFNRQVVRPGAESRRLPRSRAESSLLSQRKCTLWRLAMR